MSSLIWNNPKTRHRVGEDYEYEIRAREPLDNIVVIGALFVILGKKKDS